jgi:hypothetical protein
VFFYEKKRISAFSKRTAQSLYLSGLEVVGDTEFESVTSCVSIRWKTKKLSAIEGTAIAKNSKAHIFIGLDDTFGVLRRLFYCSFLIHLRARTRE